ncbi:hypothetical protein Pfra02_19610 [Pseudomonas fragi]|nr:hypothetical protein Pfra02_19610 [Pseudomonas fragi]
MNQQTLTLTLSLRERGLNAYSLSASFARQTECMQSPVTPRIGALILRERVGLRV